jgi:hypothetical protein
MAIRFNPLTGNFDFTGSGGGGGGSSYIDGEVQNFSALPQTIGSPAVDSAYLVREAEGAWLLSRKPAGIYIRTDDTGVRAADWTYAGEFPDVFNDANLVVYANADSTKNVKFDVSAVTTGTTRTITVPDANVTLPNQGTSTADNVTFNEVTTDSNLNVGGDLIIGNAITVGINGVVFENAPSENTSLTTLATASRFVSLPDASGTIALTSNTTTNLWIPASAWIPKTTAGCGVDSRETTTNDQNFDELLFESATSDEFADALVIMPSNYNNGTITARFYWTADSGSGGVAWGIQGRAFANDDALDTAAGTAQLVTDTLIAANDMHITSATSAVTIGGTPAANTPIQFTIYRDISDAGDDLGVDARLLGVEILFN